MKTDGEEGGVEAAGDDAAHSGREEEDESTEKRLKLVLLTPTMLLVTPSLVSTTWLTQAVPWVVWWDRIVDAGAQDVAAGGWDV